MDREEIQARLTGPCPTLGTPFNQDGSIDYDGVRDIVDFLIDSGRQNIMLTAGDSLFTVLSDQEIGELMRVVVEHTAGRALVVGADRGWGTGQSVEFAKYAQEVGADVLMVRPAHWAESCTPRTFTNHYRSCAEHIPVMVVTNVFDAAPMTTGIETLKQLREEVPGVVAVKDDIANQKFGRKISTLFHDDWIIIGGGPKEHHLQMAPYGAQASLSAFSFFAPQVTDKYWQAIASEDWRGAARVIEQYERPFFEFIFKLPGGFDAGIHGTLELFGIAQRWRRPPYHSLTDEEMEKLADFFKGLSLL